MYSYSYLVTSLRKNEEETAFEEWIRRSQFEQVKDSQNQDLDLHIAMFNAGDKYQLEDLQIYARHQAIPLL